MNDNRDQWEKGKKLVDLWHHSRIALRAFAKYARSMAVNQLDLDAVTKQQRVGNQE